MGSPSTGVRAVNVTRSAAQVLDEHTTLELECIDRMYLNVYVPVLQTGAGASYFFRQIGPCVRAERCTVIRPPRRGGSDRSSRHGH